MSTSEHLLLREWRETDREPFAALNADPYVMRYYTAPMTRTESDAFVDRCIAHQAANGFCFFALQLKETGEFIGFTGLSRPSFEAHFMPCVEIGWRLSSQHWNRGYATEAARECLRLAFGTLGLREVVAFTVPVNLPSRRVMEKLGMNHDPADDFDHPRLPEDHPFRRHVLYRATSPSIVR